MCSLRAFKSPICPCTDGRVILVYVERFGQMGHLLFGHINTHLFTTRLWCCSWCQRDLDTEQHHRRIRQGSNNLSFSISQHKSCSKASSDKASDKSDSDVSLANVEPVKQKKDYKKFFMEIKGSLQGSIN